MQIDENVKEPEGTTFALEISEKEVGDEVIALLQQDKNPSSGNDTLEIDSFHWVATKLSIMSLREVLIEKRSLKRLLVKYFTYKYKKKESIVIFILYLLRNHAMFFKNEYSDGVDSPNSGPCFPSTRDCIDDVSRNGRNNEVVYQGFTHLILLERELLEG